MVSDIRVVQARDLHARSGHIGRQAVQCRNQRDRIVRQLRREDPGYWTYTRLASSVGCSPELIAYIIKGGKKP